MILATQYRRPPFPERRRWRADLEAIKETGFDAIVVSALWSWIEAVPGGLDFSDEDELIDMAAELGLGVVINVWAELQPLWIHRELPGSEMVDHMGRRVASSQLVYAQFGLSPGGCTDHPAVRERATQFMTATASRYADHPAVLQWDCWNEIRWLTQADGYVCFCDHTLAGFRAWLRERYGDLDGLNRAWHRRYASWADVRPAKLPTRTYTDSMAYQAFLTHRAAADLRWRYEALRAGDPERPIVAHTAFPSVHCTGEFFEYEPALARGNDWELADQVDGLGSSHFPAWIHRTAAEYGTRLEASRCAAEGKRYWIAELQGGAGGHGLQAMRPVPGRTQARWIWSGVARGAKGVAFWCWRDEVFGRESSGFGIVGSDGHAAERLAELRRTADLFGAHGELLDAYQPDPAAIGVVLEPRTYQLDWAGTLGAGLTAANADPFQAGHAVQGYLLALERLQLPYDVLDPAHALDISRYRVLLMPWPLIVDPAFGARVRDWVEAGGTLLVESELDAFDEAGLYRYPDERPFARMLGLEALGRRPLDGSALAFTLDGVSGALEPATWVEPLNVRDAEVLAQDERGATMLRRSLGAGSVIAVGSFAGTAYFGRRSDDFERFVSALVEGAGGLPPLRCSPGDGDVVQWRLGRAGDERLLFVVNAGAPRTVELTGPLGARAINLETGVELPLRDAVLRLDLDADAYRVVRLAD